MGIADAYVDLHVNGEHLDGEVRSSVRNSGRGADKEADGVGDRLGARMAAGFVQGFSKRLKGAGGSFTKGFQDAFRGLNPRGLMIPALIAALPLLTSAVSALTGTLVAFTGAVVQAGTSSFALVGVLGSLVQAKIVAAVAFKDFAKAAAGDEKALAALGPVARRAARSAGEVTKAWGGLRKAVQEQVFAGLDTTFSRVATVTLPVLRKGFVGTGVVLNGIFKDLGGFVTSEGFLRRFGAALKANNAILQVLGKAARPILSGLLNVFRALQPAGLRLAGVIARAGQSFQAWSSAPGFAKRIDDMMRRAFRSAGNLWGIIRNLGAVLRNVFGAATPAGGGLLKTLNDLTKRLADFTELASTKDAVAKWAQRGIDATAGLFRILGKIGSLIVPLFNPSIAGGFFAVFEKAMPTIQAVVGTIQDALAPVLKSLGDAFAENGPKFAALFKAVAPLLKGVGSVVGELIKQVFGTLGTVASVLTPVIAAISNFLGPLLTKFAPIIATVIFAFTNWTSAILKVVPVVGRLLSPLAKLAEWIWGLVTPALKVLGAIFGAVFKGMARVGGAALKALGAGVKIYFTAIRVIITTVLKVVWAVVKFVWGGIVAVVRGAAKMVSTVVRTAFNIVRTVVTTVLKGVWAVVRVVWRGISLVISGAVRGVVAVVRGAWNLVKAVTVGAWNALSSVTAAMWARLVSLFSNGIDRVLGFVLSLPGRIMNLAASFLAAGRELGGSIIGGLMDGLRAVGGFVGDLAGSVKGAINGALNLPFTIKGPGPLPDFTIPAFARGTNFAPGGLALVGERGPELVNLPRGSGVRTAAETQRTLAPRPPVNIEVNNPLPERASQSVARVLSQRVYEAGWST